MAFRDTAPTFDNDQSDNDLTESICLACYEAGIVRYKVASTTEGPEWDILPQGRAGIDNGLATSIDVSPDWRVYTVHLNPDLRSSAGNPLIADDVIYTFKRAFALKAQGAFFAGVMGLKPGGIEKVNAHTVRFTLTGPNPIFLKTDAARAEDGLFDSKAALSHATSADPWSKAYLGANTPGFGPYFVENSLSGEDTVLYANPNWYRGKPYFDQILWQAVNAEETSLALLERGAVDAVDSNSLSPSAIQKLKGKKGITVSSHSTNRFLSLVMRVNQKPLHDPRVRQAIAWAMPYNEIISTVYSGSANLQKSPLPPSFPGYTSEFWPYEPEGNMAKASALMKQAASGKFDVSLCYDPSQPPLALAAPIIKAALAPLGVTVTLNPVTTATWAAQLFAPHTSNADGMILVAPNPVVADPAYALYVFWYSTSNPNWSGWNNPEYDKLVLQMRPELDFGKRLSLARQAQQLWESEAPWVMLAQPLYQIAHKASISDFVWNTYDLWYPGWIKGA